jgi:hypothetical protein
VDISRLVQLQSIWVSGFVYSRCGCLLTIRNMGYLFCCEVMIIKWILMLSVEQDLLRSMTAYVLLISTRHQTVLACVRLARHLLYLTQVCIVLPHFNQESALFHACACARVHSLNTCMAFKSIDGSSRTRNKFISIHKPHASSKIL